VWRRGNAHEISLPLTTSCLERTMLQLHVTQGVTWGTMDGMINAERQAQSSDGEMSAEHLGTLLCQVSKTSIGEIDSLIAELKTLHKKLLTDGDRIQRDIAEHAELSQQVIQLTKIIFDSVKKLPGRAA
jgi:predicted PilT family ATPase